MFSIRRSDESTGFTNYALMRPLEHPPKQGIVEKKDPNFRIGYLSRRSIFSPTILAKTSVGFNEVLELSKSNMCLH